MGYQKERDTFIAQASREGLGMYTIGKLLRYATMLQRLAEAQCNGDYPYNGDRDRRMPTQPFGGAFIESEEALAKWRERWDKQYTVCPKCEASGVAKSALRTSSREWDRPEEWKPNQTKHRRAKVCPDCRTQELVTATLTEAGVFHVPGCIEGRVVTQCIRPDCGFIKAHFGGDPRGAVLVLETPGYPWSDDGGKGRGLYVPARSR